MSNKDFNSGLLQFLQQSPTPFHAVASMAEMLDAAGFEKVDEARRWSLEKNRSYYVVRNDSALIAFKTGAESVVENGFRLAGTHTDSPALKIKPMPQITNNGYFQLGVEVYGGALLHPWFDRDLSIAGRVDFETENGEIASCLIDMQEPVAFIPSLAIHLNKGVNEGRALNKQKDLPPILLQVDKDEAVDFNSLLLEQVKLTKSGTAAVKVLAHELLLYDTQAPALVGLNKQFIASARLDNLLSCYVALKALIDSAGTSPSLLVCNDHEEVGSVSSSGAQGPFLRAVMERIVNSDAGESAADDMERTIHQSLLISVDNAHGIHPNFADKHDDKHGPVLNAGPVIKMNANQRYASNSKSVALFKSLCDKAGVATQTFVMRSDMACGSTIGPITSAELGITTVDIGLASFGMHSIREMAGAEDPQSLAQVLTAFFSR